MPSASTRHTRSAIRTTPTLLPTELSYLRGLNFIALAGRSKNGKTRWTVEFDAVELKNLLDPYQKLAEAQIQINSMKAMLQARDVRLEEQSKVINELRTKQATLLKNIESHYVEKPHPRSPKNYIEVAKERATNLETPPLRGGAAGLEKK